MIGKLKPDCNRINNWIHVLYDGTMILCCMDYRKETASININDQKDMEAVYSAPAFLELREQAMGQRDSAEDFICRRCTSPGG